METVKETAAPTTITINSSQVRDTGKVVRTKRSGGPRTAAGKALSARNSLKTGTYSTQIVLPGENQEAYLELEGYFLKEYNPQTITEGMLVADITKCTWKKLRLERIESNHFISYLNQMLTLKEYKRVGLAMPYWVGHDDLNRVAAVEELDLEEQQLLFDAAEKWIDDFPTQDEFDAELLINPLLKSRLTRQAELKGLLPPTPERLYHFKTRKEYHQEGRLMTEILHEIHEEIGPLVWVLRHKTEIFEAQQRIRDERMRQMILGASLTRQFDDLQRNLFRLMDELSKVQMRRLSKTVADAHEPPRCIKDKQNV